MAGLAALALSVASIARAASDGYEPGVAAGPSLVSGPGVVAGEVRYAGGAIHIAFKPALYNFSQADLMTWVAQSARAVTTYFGRFPVASASLAIEPSTGLLIARGSATSGREPSIRLVLGRSVTARELSRLSVLVHEMTHLAIPALDARHIWLHEGIATYVEHVARAQAGLATEAEVWHEFMREMPTGLPGQRDPGGLDASQSQERRYWGGALFCLLADIEIRKASGNRRGLQDALRGVQQSGGNLSHAWSLHQTLSRADREIGSTILVNLYETHGARAATPDLPQLWRDLGIRAERGRVVLDDKAPLAHIRRAITRQPSGPLLVAEPRLIREASLRLKQ